MASIEETEIARKLIRLVQDKRVSKQDKARIAIFLAKGDYKHRLLDGRMLLLSLV